MKFINEFFFFFFFLNSWENVKTGYKKNNQHFNVIEMNFFFFIFFLFNLNEFLIKTNWILHHLTNETWIFLFCF